MTLFWVVRLGWPMSLISPLHKLEADLIAIERHSLRPVFTRRSSRCSSKGKAEGSSTVSAVAISLGGRTANEFFNILRVTRDVADGADRSGGILQRLAHGGAVDADVQPMNRAGIEENLARLVGIVPDHLSCAILAPTICSPFV